MQNYLPLDPRKIQLRGKVDFSTFNLNFNDVLTATKNVDYTFTGDLTTIANYTDENVPFEGLNGLVFTTGHDVITDLNFKEVDKIVIKDADANHAGIVASAQGHDTLINLNNLGTILLQNVTFDKVVSVHYMVDHGMLIFA